MRIFKLLLRRCSNYNMSSLEHMTYFIRGLKAQARVLLDFSVGGTVRTKNEDEVK